MGEEAQGEFSFRMFQFFNCCLDFWFKDATNVFTRLSELARL